MDQSSGHLSDAQIEQYGVPVAGEQPAGGQAVDNYQASQIETHLADCPACRERVLESQRTRFGLLMDPPVNISRFADGLGPSPDCPGEDALRTLAAGLSSAEEASRLTKHAAQCDHCGALLHVFAEDFSDELRTDDQAVLGRLRSGSPGWQEKLAKRMMAEAGRAEAKSEEAKARKPFLWRWVMAPTAVAACVVIAFAVWNSQRQTPERVAKMLAREYTDKRTMEMRFPGAAYGPMRATRGSGAPISQSPAFLQAEETIRHQMQRHPGSAVWSREKARAEMLRWRPEAAVAILLGAPDPNSTAWMLDLSLAYFQLGEISRDAGSYGKALEWTDKVLQQDPGDPVALFNRALLDERLDRTAEAVRDWNLVLDAERAPGWSAEARARRDAIVKLQP